MGYTPYKMLGHELPGPKQRTPATLKAFGTNTLEGPKKQDLNPGSGLNYGDSGVGSSPAKSWLSNIAKKVGGFAKKAMDPLGLKDKAKKALGIGGDSGGDSGGAVTPHGDEAHTGGGEAAAADATGKQSNLAAMDASTVGDPIIRAAILKAQGKEQGPVVGINKEDVVKGQFGGTGLGGASMMANSMSTLSDIRAKEKIERTGKSPSGIPTYEFNYIGDNNRYSGVMAQDLIEMNIDAVSMDDSGFYTVNYNNIDVDMHLIN
jgi:hypothetical protein